MFIKNIIFHLIALVYILNIGSCANLNNEITEKQEAEICAFVNMSLHDFVYTTRRFFGLISVDYAHASAVLCI